MAHIYKKFLQHFTHKKRIYVGGLAGAFCISFFLLGTFFITRGDSPHTAELAFTEHALVGGDKGSVIPASCESGYEHYGGECYVPPPDYGPSVTINPSIARTVALGQPIAYSSVATDEYGVRSHEFEWQKPDGQWNWQTPADPDGSVTYAGTTTFSARSSNNLGATFTPTLTGTYNVRFVARDTANQLGYSVQAPINVIVGVGAEIIPDPTNISRLRWECFNSNRATLVTTNGSTANDFTNRTLPPSFGTFTPTQGATYTLTCLDTNSGESDTFVYTTPSLTATNILHTSADIAWNCNNVAAQSVILQRIPGGSATYNTGNGTRSDTDLSPATSYTYIVRCFDGLNGSGLQIGTANINITTLTTAQGQAQILGGQATDFTLSAYVQITPTDPTVYSSLQPLTRATPDGSFHSWSYQVTGATPTSCVMDQRNDNGAWYPNPAYATNISGYTFLFNSLNASERAAFMGGFAFQHDWRLTCTDQSGRVGRLVWSLQKASVFPTVLEAALNLNCTPAPAQPTINVQCSNSDYYEVTNGLGAVIASGPSTNATVSLGGVEGLYRVTCKQGGASGTPSRQVLRTYSASMCTSQASALNATPRTIRRGSATTLTWTILQPNDTCQFSATPVCSGACSPARTTAAAAVNTKLQTENTDVNDPHSAPGIPRTITEAIQEEAYSYAATGKGMGKKTLQLDYSTDFELSCGTSTPSSQRVRVVVTNDNEG